MYSYNLFFWRAFHVEVELWSRAVSGDLKTEDRLQRFWWTSSENLWNSRKQLGIKYSRRCYDRMQLPRENRCWIEISGRRDSANPTAQEWITESGLRIQCTSSLCNSIWFVFLIDIQPTESFSKIEFPSTLYFPTVFEWLYRSSIG